MKQKTAQMGMFLAAALICSYVETLIPINFGIPGIKLGLTNIVVLLMLYLVGAKEAFCVSMLRILLSGFMFGNAFSIVYSFAGGVLSFFVMLCAMRLVKLHVLSVSVLGGIFHNIGQMIFAAILVNNIHIMYYVPVLLVSGAVTGFLIGILANEIIPRIERNINNS